MSTVHELTSDSPTVPYKYISRGVTAPTSTDESGHGRSSSAPTDGAAASAAYPPFAPRPEQEVSKGGQPVWMNRQAAASTKTLHGLGLSLPADSAGQDDRRHKGSRQKPNLRIEIRNGEPPERPPPPPPKSPRHERNASAHSRTSSAQSQISTHEYSPLNVAQSMACTAVKPTFVHHNAARSSPSVQEQPMNVLPHSRKASIQSSTHSLDVERGRNPKSPLLRKPVPPLPQSEDVEKPKDDVRPPSSKFSIITSLSVESDAAGEKTPKGSIAGSEAKPGSLVEARPTDTREQLKLRVPDSEDLAPPTPRKDNFYTQNKNDEKGRVQNQRRSDEGPMAKAQRGSDDELSNLIQPRGGQNFQPRMHIQLNKDVEVPPPPPTPRKDHEVISQKPAESAKLQPPQREPPKRPESPQATTATDSSSSKSTTPEMPSRAMAPEPRPKVIIVDKGPTPDLPDRAGTPVQDGNPPDPRAALADLTKQTEALHKRYATLRSDRQKLSTSIVASLKEQKAGPEYVNTLLDQHLSLAAINSSMDICFAKLKSLECRKEAAMAAIVAEHAAKQRPEKSKKTVSNYTQPESSTRSGAAVGPAPSTSTRAKDNTSPSKLRKDSAHLDDSSLKFDPPRKDSDVMGRLPEDQEKRNTVIKASPPEPTITGCTTTEPQEFYNTDVDEEIPRKIRIKGAKAAKILGLMKEAADGRPGSPGITLPDELPSNSSRRRGPAIEVHIPVAPRPNSPPNDAHTRGPPNVSSRPSTRRDTGESASSARSSSGDGERSELHSRAGSSVESSPEEQEIQTPKDEDSVASEYLKGKQPKGRSAKRALVQTIQVYVDDEILDYYHQATAPIKK